jgi:hypothetical protein
MGWELGIFWPGTYDVGPMPLFPATFLSEPLIYLIIMMAMIQ